VIHRAYALFHVKAIRDDIERRELTGIATTPEPDRHGDILEPLGVTFKNPLPLLVHHDSTQPVGTATFQKPTKDGIGFTASIARIDEPGPLKTRTDDTWQSVKAGLITGVSIGFRALDMAVMQNGGLHFLESEVVELSLVTIPANAAASILTIKQLDTAATGHHAPGVSGLPIVRATKDVPPMANSISDQIAAFENTRTAKDAARVALMTKAANENQTLDADQADQYDGLSTEITSIDAHLTRLRALEKSNVAAAVPVAGKTPEEATKTRSGVPIITVKANVKPGTAFVRLCQAKAYGNGDSMKELAFAAQWKDSTPEVETVLKAAVAAGTTTDATWAGPLAVMQPLANEFLELLRPATILGKIPGFRRVPFNVSVPAQTGGGTYAWVGQGAPKPVGKLAFSTITLGITKAAGIIAITEELARTSSPSAEDTIRNDMIEGMARYLDNEFIDPTKVAVANVSPGSVTNGVTPITSAGTTPANARTDIIALLNALTAANIPITGAVIIMSEANALALSASLNALGQPLYPGMTINGGTAPLGVAVVTSQTAGANVIALSPMCILFADDGGVTIDVSREASVQMDSAPMNPPDATVVFTSFWQSNLIGLRAERFINWKKARTGCVQYTVQTYAG
jgi:HK97 family phage major capsid protein/HK97 family phage prohead protease